MERSSAPPSERRIQPGQSRLLLLVIRPARPMLAEVPLADLFFDAVPFKKTGLFALSDTAGPPSRPRSRDSLVGSPLAFRSFRQPPGPHIQALRRWR